MTTIVSNYDSSVDFEGIYDVPEAARYLRASAHGSPIYPMSSTKLIRWIRRGLASPDLIDLPGNELLIAFEDLISIRVIAALRTAGVRWGEIHRTEQWLRHKTGHLRPFATEHLWMGQGQIFVDWTEKLISASRNGQLALDLLRDYLIPIHGLRFSEVSRLASSWEPVDGIVLQPMVQFGSPCIKGTRIPTRSIFGMIEAGDSFELVAQAYRLSQEEVQGAYDWESSLRAA